MERPWTTSELRRLGRKIRQAEDPARDVAEYPNVMLWYNELATKIQQDVARLDWSPLLAQRPVLSSRAKTVDTLKQKLDRDPATPLQSVQDIAGVRFECEMTLSEQDAVAGAIQGMFGVDLAAIHDLRTTPHSGYRAVHVWLRLPEGRVEIQIRTALQAAWANVYESVADVLGRQIRYGDLPADEAVREAVVTLQNFSVDIIAKLEADADARQREELGIVGAWPTESAESVDEASQERRMQIQELAERQKLVHDEVIARLEKLRAAVDAMRSGGN